MIWTYIVKNYSPWWIEFWGMQVVALLAFWVPCTVYITLDKVAPKFSQRHKIQPAPKQPTIDDIRQCLVGVLQNQTMAIALQIVTLYMDSAAGKSTPHRVEASLPGGFEFIRDIVLCTLLREAGFYYSHRLFHHPRLYKRFHKKHHKFTAPVALAAQYAHPVEHLFANMLPVALPSQILHTHILTSWVFVSLMLLETSTVHSGYDFFSGAAKKHDLHHEKFMLNFGGIGLLDWVHGTNTLPKSS